LPSATSERSSARSGRPPRFPGVPRRDILAAALIAASAALARACAPGGFAGDRPRGEAAGAADPGSSGSGGAESGGASGSSAAGEPVTVRIDAGATLRGQTGGRVLRRPRGISLDHMQRVFVADTGNNRVVVLDANGSVESEFGRFGSGDGQFLSPTDVAAREGFFVYVVDAENERVQKFDRFRSFVEVVVARGGIDGAFGVPQGIEIDDQGRLYVTDVEQDKVWVLDSFSGSLEMEIGGFGATESRFVDPTDVAIGPDRRILVTDTGNGRVQVFDRLGSFLFSLDGSGPGARPLRRPEGIAYDRRGLVYVSDPTQARVVIFDADGRPLAEIGAPALSAPSGLAFDGDSTLFVVDTAVDGIVSFVVHVDAAEGE